MRGPGVSETAAPIERRQIPVTRKLIAGVAWLLIAGLLGVLPAETEVAAQPLTPHFPAWERYFEISWEPFERRGRPHLSGYVVNKYGATASRVKLLVESIDPAGRIVAQRVEWLGGTVPVFSQAYFEVPAPEPAASYRVSVFAFDFMQAARIESP
jgi:hypothetical protein